MRWTENPGKKNWLQISIKLSSEFSGSKNIYNYLKRETQDDAFLYKNTNNSIGGSSFSLILNSKNLWHESLFIVV